MRERHKFTITMTSAGRIYQAPYKHFIPSNNNMSEAPEPEAKRAKLAEGKANVLMVGTGEYTTGYVGGTAADSDKGAGVVALTMFDLRRRGKVDRVGMCGVNVRS